MKHTVQVKLMVIGFIIFFCGLLFHMYRHPNYYRDRNPFAKWFPSIFTESFFHYSPVGIAAWGLLGICIWAYFIKGK